MADSPARKPKRTDDAPGGGPPPLSKDEQQLRDQALNFFKGDIEKLNGVLQAFLKRSNAKCAILVTKSGHTITREGTTDKVDTDTVAALVSGAFAATQKLFEVFGEKDFALTVQKGKHESVYLGLVGGRVILTVLFDEATTQGAVQLYAQETTKKIEQVFDAIARGEGAQKSADDEIKGDFEAEGGGALDNVFGS